MLHIDSFSSWAIILESREEEMQTMHTMFINSWHTHKRNATSTFYVQPHDPPSLCLHTAYHYLSISVPSNVIGRIVIPFKPFFLFCLTQKYKTNKLIYLEITQLLNDVLICFSVDIHVRLRNIVSSLFVFPFVAIYLNCTCVYSAHQKPLGFVL